MLSIANLAIKNAVETSRNTLILRYLALSSELIEINSQGELLNQFNKHGHVYVPVRMELDSKDRVLFLDTFYGAGGRDVLLSRQLQLIRVLVEF